MRDDEAFEANPQQPDESGPLTIVRPDPLQFPGGNGGDEHPRNGNGRTNVKVAPKLLYDCLKCPAYCCSYAKININKRDLNRLARHFGISPDAAIERFTKLVDGEQVLRHQKDDVYGSVCMFLDKKERRCTIYKARPGVCHEYPDRPRCGYYEFLRWERHHQGDHEFVPLKKG